MTTTVLLAKPLLGTRKPYGSEPERFAQFLHRVLAVTPGGDGAVQVQGAAVDESGAVGGGEVGQDGGRALAGGGRLFVRLAASIRRDDRWRRQ